MNLMPQSIGDWIAIATFATATLGTIVALKVKLDAAKHEAEESTRVARAAHTRLDEHEKRISTLEAQADARAEMMVTGLARLDGQVGQLVQRFDAFLFNTVPSPKRS